MIPPKVAEPLGSSQQLAFPVLGVWVVGESLRLHLLEMVWKSWFLCISWFQPCSQAMLRAEVLLVQRGRVQDSRGQLCGSILQPACDYSDIRGGSHLFEYKSEAAPNSWEDLLASDLTFWLQRPI